jgi:hypothetical protein
MFSRIWIANVILALLVAFFGLKAYGVWFQENKGFKISGKALKPVHRVAETVGMLDKVQISPESEYDSLMTLNLFSPDRTEILVDEVKPSEGMETKSPAEQVNREQFLKRATLYGMVITEGSAEALVSNPTPKPVIRQKRRLGIQKKPETKRLKVKQTKWVKAGDAFGDFEVVAIKPDRILLKAGGQSYDLLLHDKEKVRTRGPARPKTVPTVVGADVRPSVQKVKGKEVNIPLRVKKGTKLKKGTKVKKGTELKKGVEVKPQLDARPPAMWEDIDRSRIPRKTGGFGRPQAR